MSKSITFCIDFDGTCVMHEFPAVGPDVPGAAEVLKELSEQGHNLILWTMRSRDSPKFGDVLAPAVEWFESRGIRLFGVNANPSQSGWSTSPKAYAHVFVDDAALGCPLLVVPPPGRPCVDWRAVREYMVGIGALPA